MSQRARTIVVWVCSLLLLLPFGGFAAWVLADYRRERVDYRPVEATILEAAVRDGPGRGANYYPHVKYRYVVDARTFTSTRYRASGWSSDSPDGPQTIVSRYPVGSRQLAWYDPARPGEAVLVRELNWLALTLALLGCALPIGILIAYYRLRPDARG